MAYNLFDFSYSSISKQVYGHTYKRIKEDDYYVKMQRIETKWFNFYQLHKDKMFI